MSAIVKCDKSLPGVLVNDGRSLGAHGASVVELSESYA